MTTEYTPNFGLAMPDFRMGPWHDLMNGNTASIDALLYSALSNTNVVAWTNDTLYNSGVSVVDNDNATIWLCLLTHTSPPPPTTFAEDRTAHPNRWTQLIAGFAPRGEWQNNTDYFPYDLAFSTTEAIFAICQTRHTSNPSGTLKDDEVYWAFLFDMSEANIGSALAVTYDPTTSGMPATNVQQALDYVDSVNDTQHNQIVALNDVNVAQGDAIDTKLSKTVANTLTTAQQDQLIADLGAMASKGGQTVTGGFKFTPHNLGNLVTFSPNPLLGNYQYGTNIAAHTWNAPTVDCAVDILITNGGTPGAITFTGFAYNASNAGDPLNTTPGHKFLVSIRRINAVSTLIIKALQ